MNMSSGENDVRKLKSTPLRTLISHGRMIGEVISNTKNVNLVFSYPSLYCTGRYMPIKTDVTSSIRENTFVFALPSPGIIKVSAAYITQQIT